MRKNKLTEDTESKVKITLNLPKEIDTYVRQEAARRGIAKTHMIIFALSWYRDYNRTLDLMPKLIDKIDLNDLKNKEQ